MQMPTQETSISYSLCSITPHFTVPSSTFNHLFISQRSEMTSAFDEASLLKAT
jgi:hypothetical protein